MICTYCGILVSRREHATTRSLNDTELDDIVTRAGTAHLGARRLLVLGVRDGQSFYFAANEITEFEIGRKDPATGDAPLVDLAAFNGAGKGVSRRHAVIRRQDTVLKVSDLNSANGTFLNGHRLVAHQDRILRDDDELRLGFLVINVKFEQMSPGDSNGAAASK
ncbi:MAG: FHA domain-containing protein [Chloroflexi bacterium]|nr:FHA domain-containing protein [Chloroflexota bacterium]